MIQRAHKVIHLLFFTAAFWAVFLSSESSHATEAFWAKLRDGGYTVLIRHTSAPGNGDPANFELGKCETQRNLSQQGRLEARRLGARFASSGAVVSKVYASQWCRTRQTAELAFGRITAIEDLPAINSFYRDNSTRDKQTENALEVIRNFAGSGNQILVTHQVNITALTSVFPREGEAIIVRIESDKLEVKGRLTF